MLEKGKKIGEYFLIEKIGHGGFGDVWLAEKRTALSISQFALKFFRPQTANEIEIESVQREIEVWQKISGLPNVISVIEADFAEDYIYIVSEYADGGSLQNWLKINGGKAESVEQATDITLQVLNGLEHLHRSGFIHRDIKPANILIRKGTFCLADFGVTREIKTHSITLHTAGTYNYMPPEAFNKKPIVSPATDIWAVAVIFQELLTGKLPFTQDEIPSLMYSILHDEPDEMPEYVPAHIKNIVRKALHKERKDRYATAQEMIDALKEFQTVNTGNISAPAPEISVDEPKKSVDTDTIIDETFVKTNRIPEIDVKQSNLTEISPNSWKSVQNQSFKPPVKISPRRLKRNKMLVAGIAAIALFVLAAFIITANLFKTNPAEFYERGLACSSVQDYDCAITNFNRAVEMKSDYFEAYKQRAAAFYANGDFQKAVADYNRGLQLNPNDASLYYGRGVAFANGGEFDRAIEDYTKAISINNQDASFIYSRGLAFFNKNQYDRAIEDYNRAIEINPNYAEAFNNRGNALDEQGKNKAAVEDYTKAIAINPNFALAYSNRGTSFARQGNYSRAIEDLNKALEIDPNLTTAYFNRANIYYLKNDLDLALADYNRFIEQNPNNSLAYSNRAGILGNKKNYAQAIEDYNRAIELNPQDAQSYYNRAVVHDKLGNKEKAQSDRQRYNDLRINR